MKTRTAVGLLGVLTAAKICLFLLFVVRGNGGAFTGGNAADVYLPAAERILTMGSFNDASTREFSAMAPAYPYLLAGLKLVSAEHALTLAVILQMLIDFVIALLLFAFATRLDIPKAGLLAGALWLLYPPALTLSVYISAETLFTLFLVTSLLLLIAAIERESLWLGLLAGLLLGVATLVRGSTMLLPGMFLLYALVRLRKELLRLSGLYAVGAMLVVLPWTIRNYIVLDDFIPVQSSAGTVMLQGSMEELWDLRYKNTPEGFPRILREAELAGIAQPTIDRESAFDRWKFQVGLRNYRQRLAERPLSMVPFMAHKFFRLWYGVESMSMKKQVILGLCALLVVPLGLLQLWSWRRERPAVALVLGLALTYFVLLHWILLPNFRFLVPLHPFLLLGASHWVLAALNRRTQATRERSGASPALALPGSPLSVH